MIDRVSSGRRGAEAPQHGTAPNRWVSARGIVLLELCFKNCCVSKLRLISFRNDQCEG